MTSALYLEHYLDGKAFNCCCCFLLLCYMLLVNKLTKMFWFWCFFVEFLPVFLIRLKIKDWSICQMSSKEILR